MRFSRAYREPSIGEFWSEEERKIGRAAAAEGLRLESMQASRAAMAARFGGRLSAADLRALKAAIVERLRASFIDGAVAAVETARRQRKRLAGARKSARQERHAAIQAAYGRTSKRLAVAQRVAATARKMGISERTVYRALE
jgi:hypothetical protein